MSIVYQFDFPDHPTVEFSVDEDSHSCPTSLPDGSELPKWTELSFHICPHCTLDPEKTNHCPLAVNTASIIDRFATLVSFEETRVSVTSEQRTYIAETSIQQGLSSLLGLVIATSGCPHTVFLRPMAHFHLPVSSGDETIFRAIGMYLIGEYLKQENGEPASFDLTGLNERYEKLETVNTHTANRVRAATSKDASVNAIVLLDFLAKNLTFAIAEQLEEIRQHWNGYISD